MLWCRLVGLCGVQFPSNHITDSNLKYLVRRGYMFKSQISWGWGRVEKLVVFSFLPP